MRAIASWVSLGAICCGTPALADHMGPSGGIGGGGGMSVVGPGTLDEGHAAIGFRLTYTRPEHRSDAELEALSDRGVDAHNTDHNEVAALSVAYGITHELTVSAELPYVRRDNLRVGQPDDGVARLGNVSGVGDLNLLAKYRLTRGRGFGLALIGGIKTPTGSTRERDVLGERLEAEHQPGTGSWDPIAGVAAGAKLGALNLSASALYQLSTIGAQRTRLGKRIQGGVALSHHFGPAEEESDEDDDHHHPDTPQPIANSWDAFVELAGEREGRQRVGGEVEQASGGTWAWIAPGARFNWGSGWSAGAGLAVPVWQRIRRSHPNNAYRMTLTLGRAL